MVDVVQDNAELAMASSGVSSDRVVAERPGTKQSFLLLGGPFGPFFRLLAGALEKRGAEVLRVNVHAADAMNWSLRKATRFGRPHIEWRAWLSRYMSANAVTDLVVYGDCQYYNRVALEAALGLGIRRHVFELGYCRPDWVTYEPNGVNANSTLPRTAAGIFREAPSAPPETYEKVGAITPWHVTHALIDSFSDFLGRPLFPHYRSPYLHSPLSQTLGTVARVLRLQFGRGGQARRIAALRREARPYFLCLLQREGDSQILRHSPFGSVAGFFEAVIQDFVRHAPADALLVFKNHPLDPGLFDYGRQILRVARLLDIAERVRFFDGGNLAELARPARGVITINSTAAISALQFGVPTIAMGEAIYDIAGLTHQGGLATFWRVPERPEPELFRAFHRLVLARTQINGNYYSPRGRRIALDRCADRLMEAAAALVASVG